MKNRPRIRQSVADELLVESKHRCNVCQRNVAQIHHISRIDSKKGNDKSNLIVLCQDCHRRAHTPSFFERKITKTQLRMYKKRWTDFCREFPQIYFDKPLLMYSFLNKPRIRTLFYQLAKLPDINAVGHLSATLANFLHYAPLERMFETVKENMDFINLEILEKEKNLDRLDYLEGLPVYVGTSFYSHGLKGPVYYEKNGVKEFPYIFYKQKIGRSTIVIKITYDPRYIISSTGYAELSSRHKLSCYGIVKRIIKEKKSPQMEILPLAIGIRQPLHQVHHYIRSLSG